MKLYTGKGDQGETCLWDGSKTPKACERLQIIGKSDQLISELGWSLSLNEALTINEISLFKAVQSILMAFNTYIATPEPKSEKQKQLCKYIPPVKILEVWIDFVQEELGNSELKGFVLPRAYTHVPRTTCRELERLYSEFADRTNELDMTWLQYLNRLSDFLFICARYTEKCKYKIEVEYWKHPRDQK